jgi:hypothetical protein
MMEKITKPILSLAVLALFFLAGCNSGPEHPEEAEVKAKLVGTYCSGDFRSRLELTNEGRYISKRNKVNPFGNGLLPEKCEGNYSLKYNEETYVWTLEIEKSDESSNPLAKCKAASIEIWKSEQGYLVGEGPVKLADPFSDMELQTDKCGDS